MGIKSALTLLSNISSIAVNYLPNKKVRYKRKLDKLELKLQKALAKNDAHRVAYLNKQLQEIRDEIRSVS